VIAGRKAKVQMPLSNVCYSSAKIRPRSVLRIQGQHLKTKQHQTTPAAPKNQKTQHSLGIKTRQKHKGWIHQTTLDHLKYSRNINYNSKTN
jgi:hypothetical protein